MLAAQKARHNGVLFVGVQPMGNEPGLNLALADRCTDAWP
jgi:hypothetical protein